MNPFDPGTMKPTAKSIIYGLRNTGKTWLVRDLLTYINADVNVIAGVECDFHTYKKMDCVRNLFIEYEPCLIASWLEASNNNTFVLEDCIYDREIIDDFYFNHLMTDTSRALIMTSLFFWVHEANRFDYIFVFRVPFSGLRESLYDAFAKHYFQTLEDFCAAMDTLTIDHNCLVFDRANRKVFGYRAPGKRMPDWMLH
jgi:hypothetical protein